MDLVSGQLSGSVSANAASASSAASRAGADFMSRSFGLSMRFVVKFTSGDGSVSSLGEWSACKGLKVEFKTETVKQGGMYDYELKLPTQITYSPVVLERAMDPQSSQQLQDWLGSLVYSWMNTDDSDEADPVGSVDITLYDAHQNEVTSWSLVNAFPVAWTGPTLDAKGNTVAIETLTLEHQGFFPLTSAVGP